MLVGICRDTRSKRPNISLLEILKLAKRLHVRQQIIATAQLYIRRFYLKVEIRHTNPYLVLATALYLACKVEEAPQLIRHIVTEARVLWPGLYGKMPLNLQANVYRHLRV